MRSKVLLKKCDVFSEYIVFLGRSRYQGVVKVQGILRCKYYMSVLDCFELLLGQQETAGYIHVEGMLFESFCTEPNRTYRKFDTILEHFCLFKI